VFGGRGEGARARGRGTGGGGGGGGGGGKRRDESKCCVTDLLCKAWKNETPLQITDRLHSSHAKVIVVLLRQLLTAELVHLHHFL